MFRLILQTYLQLLQPAFLGLGSGQFSGQAAANEKQAQQAAGQYGSEAAGEGAQLNPFFSQEMRAQHGLTPGQTNEMLTAAEGGAGAVTGAAEAEATRNAARTGNATGLTKSLDEMARDKAKVAAGAGENIAAQDVAGAKALNQEGAAGMEGLYGTNAGAQLKSMGQANSDVATEIQAAAQGPSWLQGLNQFTTGVKNVEGMFPTGGGSGS